jgi:hypothetical protein
VKSTTCITFATSETTSAIIEVERAQPRIVDYTTAIYRVRQDQVLIFVVRYTEGQCRARRKVDKREKVDERMTKQTRRLLSRPLKEEVD